MKKHLTTMLLLIVFLVGLSVLLYPTVSNYWNSMIQSRVMVDYNDKINHISNEEYARLLEQADAYNQRLPKKPDRFKPTPEELAEYDSILNIDAGGVMAILQIPKLGVNLPVYHGTDAAVLQMGLGHLEGSSFPVGGPGTHAAVTGHRGLPSAELLTKLDRMAAGDRFEIAVLGELLTYEVDRIDVVLPDDMSELGIEPGQDYCTLVTCTPYGINDHRLLVRGRRVQNEMRALNVRVSADAAAVDTSQAKTVVTALMTVVFMIYVLIKYKKYRNLTKNYSIKRS